MEDYEIKNMELYYQNNLCSDFETITGLGIECGGFLVLKLKNSAKITNTIPRPLEQATELQNFLKNGPL